MRAAICARSSTLAQNRDNRLAELHRYTARGWTAVSTSTSASGAAPALDRLAKAARGRKFGVVVAGGTSNRLQAAISST